MSVEPSPPPPKPEPEPIPTDPPQRAALDPIPPDSVPKLRPQTLPLLPNIRTNRPPPNQVIVLSFGSRGIRYGYAVDTTPRRLFPAVAIPRRPGAPSEPVCVPVQVERTKEEVEEARKKFEEVKDKVSEELALMERRRGGGRPIPWKVEIERVVEEGARAEERRTERVGEVLVGHEVEVLMRDEERRKKYDVVFPLWDGKVLFGCGASEGLMRKALEYLLEYVVADLRAEGTRGKRKEVAEPVKEEGKQEDILMDDGKYATTFVALVVPETANRRDAAELVDVVFRTKALRTAAVFIHQSAVSCALGAGLATCAVVDIGHSATTVACVEDGLICGESRVHLNYGSWHIQSVFDLLLAEMSELKKLLETTPGPHGKKLSEDEIAEDKAKIIPRIAEQMGGFNVDENDTLTVSVIKAPSGRSFRVKLGVGIRALPCYGLIHPGLLQAASQVRTKRKRIYARNTLQMNADDDNFASDIFNDLRRSGIATAALPIGTFANDAGQNSPPSLDPNACSIVDAIIWSIAKAVEVKRPDQQTRTSEHYRRYLNAIVLAGGGASIDGIALALEAPIKKGFLDAGLNVADVTVIDGGKGKGDEELAAAAAMLRDAGKGGGLIDDTDTANLPWKGGAVMVEAEAVSEYWIYKDDWEARNVRALRERAPFYW